MLSVRLFGPLAVEVGGRPVPQIAGLRPRAVLGWLLLHPGRHARSRVAALFWPDVLDTSARASLRSALWTVRASLDAVGMAAYLDADRDAVGIAEGLPRSVDVEAFQELSALDDPDALRRAYELGDAPLLADLADDWVVEARDEYRERAAGVGLRLAGVLEDLGDLPGAVAWTRRALTKVPLRESAHRSLIRRLATAGERAEALAAFERCRALLAAEFGTSPSSETTDLAERLRRTDGDVGQRAGRPVRAAPLATPAGRPPDRPAVAGGHLPPTSPLAGRSSELHVLRRVWDDVRRGRGGVAVLTAPAGMGKSRLAAELVARAVRDGARCGTGSAYELSGAPAFGPWAEALHQLVAEVAPPPPDVAWPSDLARLCRSVEWRWGRPASVPATDPDQERIWLFEAVAEALAWAARDRPLLLVLEDVHLADRSSVAMLAYVGRRLAALPVLVVTTSRPATTGQDLALALDAVGRSGALVAELALAPLTAAQTELVVRAVAPDQSAGARARIVAAAEGNPLLAREAARAAVAGRDLSQGLRGWVRAPLARLDGSARLLVDTAAAAGRPLEFGEAAELVGPRALEDALEQGCRQELLSVDARRIRFVHELVRAACCAELRPERRTWLHSRLADVLDARRERSTAEVARHLLLAGRDQEACGHLVAAADQARALGAFDEATGFLREAADVAGGSAARAAELWLALAEVASWRGSREEHTEAFGRALGLLDEVGDTVAIAAAHVSAGQCLRTTLCFPRDALVAYRRASHVLEEHDLDAPELRALALVGQAWLETANGDVRRGRDLIASAEALPEVRADAGLATELALARAVGLLRSHRYAQAERESEAAAGLARRARRGDLAGTALLQAAWAASAAGAPSRALRLTEPLLRGRYGAGLTSGAHSARAYALSRQGRHEEARAAVADELALSERVGEPELETLARYDAGVVALAADDCSEAVVRLSAALDGNADQFPRAYARLRLAEARLRAGDVDGADRELGLVPFEPVGTADLPTALVPDLERVEGLVAAARGDAGTALTRWASSEAAWRRVLELAPPEEPHAANLVGLNRPPIGGVVEPGVELGRVLADRARLLAEQGRAEAARGPADEAAALADALHFDGYRETLRDLVGVGA